MIHVRHATAAIASGLCKTVLIMPRRLQDADQSVEHVLNSQVTAYPFVTWARYS
jgi:hypothetical protein